MTKTPIPPLSLLPVRRITRSDNQRAMTDQSVSHRDLSFPEFDHMTPGLRRVYQRNHNFNHKRSERIFYLTGHL